MSNVLLIPGIGRMSFAGALRLLAPYSPRLAANYQDPVGSLYTDASRTTQVAAVGNRIRSFTNQVTGQPHGEASSDAKSPLFARYPATGRRNLLTYSEDFSNAAWTKSASSVSGSYLLDTAANTQHFISVTPSTSTGQTEVFTVWAQSGTLDWTALFIDGVWASFNLQTGLVGTVSAGMTAEMVLESDGFYRCSVTRVRVNSTTTVRIYVSNADNTLTYLGDGTGSIRLQKSQLELTSRTNYQKVVTSADITEAGVRDVYASLFDGSDDCLQVSGFDLSDTDNVTVIAGARKLSDAATGFVCELGNGVSTNGTFGLTAPSSGGANSYRFSSEGTTGRAAGTGIFAAAPDSAHLVGIGDISAPLVRLWRNGSIVESVVLSQGTGNFTNATLNIGQRNNASLPFNGYLHYLFICGAIVPDSVLTKIYRGLGPRIGLTV